MAIHDADLDNFARSIGNGKNLQGIEALYLVITKMVVIDTDGKHLILLDEERVIDILGVSKSDPVVLSDVSIEPGVYQELRLVLKDECTITINGEMHPIKIPSGEQSGLKLKGPFDVISGKLFTLMIELDTDKSVSWNQGQGYRLQPVLRISNGPEVIGIFRGYLTLNMLGFNETLLELHKDNTARLRIDEYPNYTLFANYNYNSIAKTLKLDNLELNAPGLGKRALREVMKKIPNEFILPVKQWSLDNIIAIDYSGIQANLYRVDEFDFSEGVTFTEFTININYPDGSKNGKDIITEVHFIDTGMPSKTYFGKLEGSIMTHTVQVKNNDIQGSNMRILVSSYLFDNTSDWNTESAIFGGRPVFFMMTGSYFSETTNNPWQVSNVFTLQKDIDNQVFDVFFPNRMNINMNHENFTINDPIINWDSYPGASGYYVIILVNEKRMNLHNATESGSDLFAIAFYNHTLNNSIRLFSEKITFTPIHSTIGVEEPKINKGDIIRVEVYALDDSGIIDTRNKTGVLFMDSLNIIR